MILAGDVGGTKTYLARFDVERGLPGPPVDLELLPSLDFPSFDALVGEYLERHYHGWVDESIPALGGRTPRHAVRLKTVRPKVIELLKDIENGMARERAAGRPAIDLDWLWAELGVTGERG